MMDRMAWVWSQRVGAIVLGVLLVTGSGRALADEFPIECGSLRNHYGPFDYLSDKSKLWIVEQAHFTPSIESLAHGKTGTVAGELDYTLRAFPNHHRALAAMMRLTERDRNQQPFGARYTMECYLKRAEHFSPNDSTVKMIFGIYLLKNGKVDAAIEYLEAAEKMTPSEPNLQYNLGLAYVRAKRFDEALQKAHNAYASGFDLPGLKRLLERAGKWRDPDRSAAVGDTH